VSRWSRVVLVGIALALLAPAAASAQLAPTVSAVSWSNMTATSATLSATVNPNGAETTYVLAVRRVGTARWKELPAGTLPAGETAVTVTGDIAGLMSAREFELRVTATNAFGTAVDDSGRMTTGMRLTVSRTRARVTDATVVVEAMVRGTAPGAIVMRVASGGRTWCTARKAAAAAKRYRVRCNLGPRARAAVRKGPLKLRVSTTYTPIGGTPLPGTSLLTVKRTP
jgi:hypothetical protein